MVFEDLVILILFFFSVSLLILGTKEQGRGVDWEPREGREVRRCWQQKMLCPPYRSEVGDMDSGTHLRSSEFSYPLSVLTRLE